MNKKIKNLNLNKLLFFDIETVRQEEFFDENSANYSRWAWKQRDRQTNEIPPTEEVIQSYYNKAALYPEWGKIVCISVGYIKNGIINIKSFTGEEKNILVDFVNMVKKSRRILAGYNVIAFDLPYVRKRFFINKLTNYLDESQGNDVCAKPWDLDNSVFDLMVAWKGSGYANTSLDEVAMCFDIESSKNKMLGNEVSEYFYAGKINAVTKYCEEDTRVVSQILQIWQNQAPTKNTQHEEKEGIIF